MKAYEVLKTLIVTGFIIPVITWTIQECVVGSWTILTDMITVVRARRRCRAIGRRRHRLIGGQPETDS